MKREREKHGAEALPSDAATLDLVWKAMVGVVGVYAALGYWLSGGGERAASDELQSLLVPVFAGVSAAAMVAVFSRGHLLAQRAGYRAYCLIRWAAAETIGLFGLVLALAGATSTVTIAFCGWSLLSLFRLRPTADDFRRYRTARG
jgi:hypothetical protein